MANELAMLQKSYKMMENDRARYAEESQNIIKRQRQAIEKVKKENERLKEQVEAETRSRSENSSVGSEPSHAITRLDRDLQAEGLPWLCSRFNLSERWSGRDRREAVGRAGEAEQDHAGQGAGDPCHLGRKRRQEGRGYAHDEADSNLREPTRSRACAIQRSSVCEQAAQGRDRSSSTGADDGDDYDDDDDILGIMMEVILTFILTMHSFRSALKFDPVGCLRLHQQQTR
eukprot:753573-Hanusia_phi.AAC.1